MIHVNLLQDYLQCQTKSYLHFQGRSGLADEYSLLSARLDARYLADAFQWLAAQSTTAGTRHFNGSRLENLADGPAMILDALGGADGLETHFHGLQRVPGDSGLGPYSYRPIRVYRHLPPSSAVRLLLAFDALVLSRLQGFLCRAVEALSDRVHEDPRPAARGRSRLNKPHPAWACSTQRGRRLRGGSKSPGASTARLFAGRVSSSLSALWRRRNENLFQSAPP